MTKTELSDYQLMGENIRRMKEDLIAFVDSASGNVPKTAYMSQVDRMQKALDQLACDLEDRMFKDYPELSNDYLRVFYGPSKR